jgi:hypothetical protein
MKFLRWLALAVVFFMMLWAIAARCQSAIKVSSDNPICTAANPCTLQVYRAVCSGGGGPMGGVSCPLYPDPAFLLLANTLNTLSTVASSTGTKWIYTDQNGDSTRPNLVTPQLYTYVETATFNGDATRTPSLPSQPLTLPFQTNVSNAPSFPLTGTCRIVK